MGRCSARPHLVSELARGTRREGPSLVADRRCCRSLAAFEPMQILLLAYAMFGVMTAEAFVGPSSAFGVATPQRNSLSFQGNMAHALNQRRSGVMELRAQDADDMGDGSGSLGAKSKKRTNRFRELLDVNPGRSQRLERSEQEERYRQMLAVNPNDVDTLCGYACFLSTVKGDYIATAEMYSSALEADPARARRITVQLWADVEAARVQDEM